MEELKNNMCEKLWNEHEASMRRVCQVRMQSFPDEIDDVIAETFLILCKRVSSGDIPDNPKSWLYGVLNNIIKLRYRKIYRVEKKQTEIYDCEYELPFEYGGIDEKIDEIYSNEIKDKLKSLLNENEYQIIISIHYDKLKMKEVALRTNSTESAIKQKHYRICKKLRKTLKSSEKLF